MKHFQYLILNDNTAEQKTRFRFGYKQHSNILSRVQMMYCIYILKGSGVEQIQTWVIHLARLIKQDLGLLNCGLDLDNVCGLVQINNRMWFTDSVTE